MHDRTHEVGYHPQVVNRLVSLVGLPVISVPCGFSASGLPIGIQIVGRFFHEGTILRVASAYEASAGWKWRRPPLPD